LAAKLITCYAGRVSERSSLSQAGWANEKNQKTKKPAIPLEIAGFNESG
jgi:hypothetical protein